MKTEAQIKDLAEILRAKEKEATWRPGYRPDRAKRFFHYRQAIEWVLSEEPEFFKGRVAK